MKQLIAVIAILIVGCSTGRAQNATTADTLRAIHYNIYTNLAEPGANGATVKIDQPPFLKQAVTQMAAKNERTFTQSGYRLRIFSDNKQNSRQESESLVMQFEVKHPAVKAYRSYSSPYFRVSIGDFRTLNEAKAFLEVIKFEYPKAYPVKEKINFPPL
ncbi:SPOR domain-containing protein [uncultured Acetobacteroides sp.]|uniref:SPOR domain-containing protein n=1 Tax=uncultured Acetobacteroides sp. TaxID=1760811 RepID=UPI0029F46BCB|nr:SPOR domain-containing protein [uncultured Acetobacteroides sp.]